MNNVVYRCSLIVLGECNDICLCRYQFSEEGADNFQALKVQSIDVYLREDQVRTIGAAMFLQWPQSGHVMSSSTVYPGSLW